MILRTIGKTLMIIALLMLIPFAVSLIYGENSYFAFLIPIAVLLLIGIPFSCLKSKDNSIYATEGFVIVALCWIIISLVGALPFVISGEIPNYINALFETVSGFSTTGASILSGEQIESLSKGIQFWRLFTHWIGGMGVLVFVLAIIPSDNVGVMHVFRAESPGPSVGKLVSRIKYTAMILYSIYICMTVLEAIMLCFGGIGLFDSVLNAFSTAGTGGFAIYGDSIAHYNSVYVEMVMSVFMFLFGINFNLFYLILIGNFAKAIKSEEFLTYIILVVVSTIVIAINILIEFNYSFGEAVRYSFFQVTSISSTTGVSSTDFSAWPAFSKSILLLLTVVGACAGSTCGGMKISRFIVLCKSGSKDFKKLIHPRSVISIKLEGENVDKDTERNVRSYFTWWVMLVILSTILLSLDYNDVFSNFSATLACIGNVGPGITKAVGPMGNYQVYSAPSKIFLSLMMLAGRLEIFPLMVLFSPRTWKK